MLIDSKPLLNDIRKYCRDSAVTMRKAECELQSIVDRQPAVDAVPVVRCKYCQNYYIKNSRVGLCMDKNDMFVQAEDYCSDGRRYYESKD